MRIGLTTILLLLLSMVQAAHADTSIDKEAYARQAFEDACRISRYDCTGLTIPIIEFKDIPGRSQGLYYGGYWLILDVDIDVSSASGYLVLVHEVVHYLQTFSKQWDMSGCSREGEAFYVSNVVAIERDLPSLVTLDWFLAYDGCGPEDAIYRNFINSISGEYN